MLLILVCLGGVISLAVVLVVRNTKYKYILNGLVCGAAIGGGFGAFETAAIPSVTDSSMGFSLTSSRIRTAGSQETAGPRPGLRL